MHRLNTDTVLGRRYRLDSRIASGGMGDVWRAEDLILARKVAVKVLRPSLGDAKFAERFRTEARYAAGLAHANIAMVFDYGEHDDLAFLVMELVEGRSLAQMVADEGALDPGLVRSVVAQVALGLSAAHEARVIHRDIKPANILLAPGGQVKLTDFGIARAIDAVGHTQTGEITGTPQYVSPELGLGQRFTEASDIYSLGVVAHELLTGERAFERDHPIATVLAHINDTPTPLPDHVPADLRGIIEQCLEKEPGRRPVSARAIAAALGVTEVATHWTQALVTVDAAGQPQPAGIATPITPTLMLVSSAAAAEAAAWVPPQPQGRDLEQLLANLDPQLHPGEFAVVSVTDPPEGLHPFMSLLEAEGVTMLLSAEEAHEHGLEFELPLAWITLGVSRAIGTQGYVPTVTTALAQAKIASVAGVGRWHTHLFVPIGQAERAMKVLSRLSQAYVDD